MNPLERAEKLKNDLDNLRPLDREAEARIMQKFRLDWNYHSNNLEGNSLTYGETKALILFGITAQGKPLKDHFEITGHNEAINWILEIVKGETVLTESFIRQLHTLLLKESSYKEAKTPNGKPTRRLIEVGKYKTQPNHVITVTGETFYFATPEETPAKMHDLIEWFRREKEKADVNPIILAALFHYRFIRIHPFDDGNGRVARILMNFILIQFGYPSAIIKTEDKENYYAVLRLADADELEPFIEYIAQNLVRSLEIMIRGAKGESIEEPEDLDKELALLEKKLDKFGNKIIKRNKKVCLEVYERLISPLLDKIIETDRKFNKFYIYNDISCHFLDEITIEHEPKKINFSDLEKNLEKTSFTNDVLIMLLFSHSQINRSISNEARFSFSISIKFHELYYRLHLNFEEDKTSLEKKYSETFSNDEIKQIITTQAKIQKLFLEGQINQIEQAEKSNQSSL